MSIDSLHKNLIVLICADLSQKDLCFLSQTRKSFHSIIFKEDKFAKPIWRPRTIQSLNELESDLTILKHIKTKINFNTTESTIFELIDLIKFTKVWRYYKSLGSLFIERNQNLHPKTSFKNSLFSIFKNIKKNKIQIHKWINKKNLKELSFLERESKHIKFIFDGHLEKFLEVCKKQPIANLLCKNNGVLLSPLIAATEVSDLKMITHLLEIEKVDINLGYTTNPLLLASARNDIKIVRYFLEQPNINVNYVSSGGFCPLSVSIKKKNKKVLKLLLSSKNIDVNLMKKPMCLSPLSTSIFIEDCEILALLIEHPKLDINLLDTQNNLSPLIRAVLRGNVECVKTLLTHEKIDLNYSCKGTALHFAICGKNEEMCSLLIRDKRVDVNIGGEGGTTPLMIACELGLENIVKLLLQIPGINVNKKNFQNRTAWDFSKCEKIKSILAEKGQKDK